MFNKGNDLLHSVSQSHQMQSIHLLLVAFFFSPRSYYFVLLVLLLFLYFGFCFCRSVVIIDLLPKLAEQTMFVNSCSRSHVNVGRLGGVCE